MYLCGNESADAKYLKILKEKMKKKILFMKR